jgi:hypothetical protein
MEVIYEAGTRDPSEIRQLVGSVLAELRDGGEALQQARDGGLDVEALAAQPISRDDISIKARQSGFDPISTVVIVTIARPIVLDLWRKIVLPRIEARWGATALGPEAKTAKKPRKQ